MEYLILSGQDPVLYEDTNVVMLFKNKLAAKKNITCKINEKVILYNDFIKYKCDGSLDNFFQS